MAQDISLRHRTMKLITAIIKPFKLDDVREKLQRASNRRHDRQRGERLRPAEGPYGNLSRRRICREFPARSCGSRSSSSDEQVDAVIEGSARRPRPAISATARFSSAPSSALSASAPAKPTTTPSKTPSAALRPSFPNFRGPASMRIHSLPPRVGLGPLAALSSLPAFAAEAKIDPADTGFMTFRHRSGAADDHARAGAVLCRHGAQEECAGDHGPEPRRHGDRLVAVALHRLQPRLPRRRRR